MTRTIVAVSLALLLGCGDTGAPSERGQAPPPRISVELADGTGLLDPVARITIYDVDLEQGAKIELSVTGHDASGRHWGLFALPDEAFLTRGTLSLPLTDRPLTESTAAAQRDPGDGHVVFAVAGAMELTVSADRITGTVTTDDDRISAELEGEIDIHCIRAVQDHPGGTIHNVDGGSAFTTETIAVHDLQGCAALPQ